MRAFFILVTAVPLLAGAVPPCHFKVAAESWPPYVYRDATNNVAGLDAELTHAILDEAGCTLSWEGELPVMRRERLFREGLIDLQMAASDTPERRAFARFSAPYRHEVVRLFTTPARLEALRAIDGLDAVLAGGATLLAPNLGWYGADYERVREPLKAGRRLSTFGNISQGLRMLAAGRGDLIMGDAAAVRSEALRAGVSVVALAPVVLSAPVHLMLSRASTGEDVLQRVNGAIARLESRGALAAIRARYDAR